MIPGYPGVQRESGSVFFSCYFNLFNNGFSIQLCIEIITKRLIVYTTLYVKSIQKSMGRTIPGQRLKQIKGNSLGNKKTNKPHTSTKPHLLNPNTRAWRNTRALNEGTKYDGREFLHG